MAMIHEVAELAGVSVSTVSKVLGDRRYSVSEETRQKVEAAARQLGYVPNALGRSLRNKTRSILVAGTAMLPDCLKGIYRETDARGFGTVLVNSRVTSLDNYTTLFENGSVQGAVFINLSDEKALVEIAERYPVVQCGEYVDFPGSVSVSINNEKAAYEATELLIRRGKQRFGFVSSAYMGQYKYNMARDRKNGFMHALDDAGLPCLPELMRNFPYSDNLRPAAEIALSYAEMEPEARPDAILCEQNIIGVTCVNLLQMKGIRVPDEVAVAALDDTPYSAVCEPMLAAVRHPYEEMGGEAVQLLTAMMDGDLNSGKHVYLDYQIIKRGSAI